MIFQKRTPLAIGTASGVNAGLGSNRKVSEFQNWRRNQRKKNLVIVGAALI